MCRRMRVIGAFASGYREREWQRGVLSNRYVGD